ncbi:MAG: ferric reductase-like transmembrane domain-containing protein [Sandaracinaceae bacterium]|nr:ferric reductase-like transmembrane domain-containing protein [Sandaracinaceae bacterium]
MRAAISARLHGVTYALAGLAAGLVIALGAGQEWSIERDLYWIRGSAWCALLALGGALCVTPLGNLLMRAGRADARDLTRVRRALGIAAAALATLHAGLALTTWLADAWRVSLSLTWIRSGVIAWAVLALLWLTSYPTLVARLRVKLWKPLHRLAYVAFALVIHHAMLSPLAPRSWVLTTAVVVVMVGGLRLVRGRPRPRP